ncbi:hypothetical protein [Aquimarina algiphila]|uniref:hypothetical protein n=1 Tax=Aquimarina algiphila TaxID=2047982 RepID=UPI00232B41DC|nr:hypothetical protein [Aquimarina algiphila]
MAIVDRPTLYSYFETGDRPTQNQFVDLIDSGFNLAENSLAQGWVTHFIDIETDATFIAEELQIPLNTNEVSNVRFIWQVNPSGAGDVTVTFAFYYYSDIQNNDYDNAPAYDGAFYKHSILVEEIVTPGGTDPIVVDELIAADFPLVHNNLQSFAVLLILNGAESNNNKPVFSFEFN